MCRRIRWVEFAFPALLFHNIHGHHLSLRGCISIWCTLLCFISFSRVESPEYLSSHYCTAQRVTARDTTGPWICLQGGVYLIVLQSVPLDNENLIKGAATEPWTFLYAAIFTWQFCRVSLSRMMTSSNSDESAWAAAKPAIPPPRTTALRLKDTASCVSFFVPCSWSTALGFEDAASGVCSAVARIWSWSQAYHGTFSKKNREAYACSFEATILCSYMTCRHFCSNIKVLTNAKVPTNAKVIAETLLI